MLTKRLRFNETALGILAMLIILIFTGFFIILRDSREQHEQDRKTAAKEDTHQGQHPLQLVCNIVGFKEIRCSQSQPDTEGADEHTKSTLKAQHESNELSLVGLILNFSGLIITGVGTFFVARSLIVSSRATSAAVEAANYAKETLHSSRAWITPDKYMVDVITHNGVQKIRCTTRWVNSGQTPALKVRPGGQFSFAEPDAKASIVKMKRPEDSDYSVIGPGQTALGPFFIAGEKVTPHILEQKIVIHLFGVVEYTDIFEPEITRISEHYCRLFVFFEKDGSTTVQAQPIGEQNYCL